MHGRVIAGIGLRDGVDHRLRLLRGRGAVEIMPAGDRRELVAHSSAELMRVATFTALRSASRAAFARSLAVRRASSHRPMTKPSSSSARALAGSSPRASA